MMGLSSGLAALLKVEAVGKALQMAGAGLFGGVILWEVAVNGGQLHGTAIIHVDRTPAQVAVDDRTFPVDSLRQSPIVCRLRRGRHVVRLVRGGRVVHEQEFILRGGEEQVLAAAADRAGSATGP